MNNQTSVAQFRMVGNTVSIPVLLALIALSLPLLAVAFLNTGTIVGGVLGGIGGTFVVLAVVLWCMRSNSRGNVLIAEEGLTVGSLGRRDMYPWDHISAIEPVERSVMFGSNDKLIAKIPLLRIRLRGPFGVSPLARTVLIRVEDPEAFLSAAHRFMGARLSSRSRH
ncbi:MAG: hypothetical protein WD904_04720 [Dehalococcoidia bacterium]